MKQPLPGDISPQTGAFVGCARLVDGGNDVFMQGYVNSEWPNHGPRNQTPPRLELHVCADVEQLVYDIDVVYQAVLLESDGCRSRENALYALSDALNLLDLRNPFSEEFHASVAAAREFLRVHYYAPLADVTPEGGMWIEADCNVSGGEALVRQLLYGNEFFETEFGRRSKILWLPVVFGYSAALPQILKKSGIDYFFTSKLSWNEYNCSPYDTFRWKGIDGSEVLTHFTPARDYSGTGSYEKHEDLSYFTTYNAMIEPSQIKGGWQRFRQKGIGSGNAAKSQKGQGKNQDSFEHLEISFLRRACKCSFV